MFNVMFSIPVKKHIGGKAGVYLEADTKEELIEKIKPYIDLQNIAYDLKRDKDIKPNQARLNALWDNGDTALQGAIIDITIATQGIRNQELEMKILKSGNVDLINKYFNIYTKNDTQLYDDKEFAMAVYNLCIATKFDSNQISNLDMVLRKYEEYLPKEVQKNVNKQIQAWQDAAYADIYTVTSGDKLHNIIINYVKRKNKNNGAITETKISQYLSNNLRDICKKLDIQLGDDGKTPKLKVGQKLDLTKLDDIDFAAVKITWTPEQPWIKRQVDKINFDYLNDSIIYHK
ncbi:MAG: hypothetical protein E7Z92_07475 [Cyanobacteria bacterium SIG31]|nr:hypothetical protein [Cyanobacteria bacterium SIG31]